jgi:hypothetical protein
VLAGMAKHFSVEHVSQSAREGMLGVIQADKAQCTKLIDAIIERNAHRGRGGEATARFLLYP